VLFLTACTEASAPPPPPPPPPPGNPAISVSLSRDSVIFSDTLGATGSPSVTVEVTAQDTAPLAGTTVSVGAISYGEPTTGWLTYSLDRETTPAVLTLQPSKVGLAAGIYTATVPVESDVAVNSPRSIAVRLNLSPEPPMPPDPPPSDPPPGPIPGVAIVAAGNIAKCGSILAVASANLVEAAAPQLVFALGDNAYPPSGNTLTTLQDYENCYGPTWGRLKDITYAAVGGWEQDSTGLSAGADAYFGPERVGPPGANYYSFNVGTWHVIVLDILSGGNATPVPYGNGTAQLAWLKDDLAANSGALCTIAFWHEPMWYSSSNTSTTDLNIGYRRQTQRGIWNALYDANADVVLGGGDHIYERFAPMRYVNDYPGPEFRADSVRGIRQFSTGLGGDGPLATPQVATRHPLSQYRSAGNGALKLILGEGQYTWIFLNTQYSNVTDWGTGTCH
jgi:hypothetical protein